MHSKSSIGDVRLLSEAPPGGWLGPFGFFRLVTYTFLAGRQRNAKNATRQKMNMQEKSRGEEEGAEKETRSNSPSYSES